MTDWNRNGKYDISDSYIDHKIYKDMSSIITAGFNLEEGGISCLRIRMRKNG